MTPQEKINAETQKQLAMQDAKFNTFMQEMRDRDNQRANDIRELRTSIDGLGKHVQNLTIAAMVGVGTSVIAVVVLVGTTIYALLSH